MIIELVVRFLPLIGLAGIVVLAQTQIRERSERAALALTAGAGLQAAHLLAGYFFQGEILFVVSPVVRVASIAAVVYGLITLVEEVNPKRPQPLHPSLEMHKEAAPNMAPLVIFGVLAAMGMFATGRMMGSPLFMISALLGLGGTLAGAVWVDRQGPLGRWILERRPELVVWSYVHQLRVVNRQTGSTSVHWSAQLGLSTGAKVPLPAMSEGQAQGLILGVMERCPGVALGFTDENSKRFKSDPESMRGGSPTSLR